MDFLRDHGLVEGCYVNRYMSVVDEQLRPVQKTKPLKKIPQTDAIFANVRQDCTLPETL